MKVAVLLARYGISGVPLAQGRLAQTLSEAGHDVDFLVGCVNHGHQAPKLPGVEVQVLGKERVLGLIPPLVRYFQETDVDIVFSAEDHLNAVTLLAAIISNSSAKFSCSSRVTPYDTYSNIPFTKGWFLKLLMRGVMHRADALTCVSKDMVDQYRDVLNSTVHTHAYNIVRDSRASARIAEPLEDGWVEETEGPLLVAAGSLVPWKGFGTLISATAQVRKRRPVRLLILGEGPLRQDLEEQIEELGLSSTVELKGYVDNPLKYFNRADVFILSSRVEGLPNVLVEAMMCGCTPVSTDCPTGPREVLDDGRYGYLVPVGDEHAMAQAIERAIDEPISPESLQEAVRPFSQEEVLKRHFDLLDIEEPVISASLHALRDGPRQRSGEGPQERGLLDRGSKRSPPT